MASVLVTSATPQVRDCDTRAGAGAGGGGGALLSPPGLRGVPGSKAGGSVNTTILSAPRPLATPGVRFGRQSVRRIRVFSEVVLFKEKQIPAQSSPSKCHIPVGSQGEIRPFPRNTAAGSEAHFP